MKILINALSGIGDALMFSPALRLLRQKVPDAQIDMLVMFRGVEEVYARNPDLNSVFFHDFLNAGAFSGLGKVLKLSQMKYDVSIQVYPSNRWPYSVISFLIGAKKRLGHDYQNSNFRSLNFLNNCRVPEDVRMHNVEQNASLVRLIGVEHGTPLPPLQIALNETEISRAWEWLHAQGIPPGSLFVGMHAGSALFKNHVHKRWAPEKFAGLAKLLVARDNACVLLFGGPDEHQLNESIAATAGERVFVVKVHRFMDTAALMSLCSLFVSNDSGLMHTAAALQVPTVAIFAYTSPVFGHPWASKHVVVRRDLDCSPCFVHSPRPAQCKWTEDRFRCITRIEVDEVHRAAQFIMQTSRRT